MCTTGDPQPIDAVIFDTDGVVTRTAAVHMAAWKRVFDDFLADHAPQDPPFSDADYRTYVDGVGRYDGTQRFLESRGIELPHGDPSDPPGDTTICAVANNKNAAFEATVANDGVAPYATTRRFIEQLHAAGIRTAVISASRNCEMVLATAHMDDLFEVRVDGIDQAELGFPGKPEPDVFVVAAQRLGLEPHRCAVVEDAVSGVTAGAAGGFAQVIGLDRSLNPGPLAQHADIVVPDAADLEVVASRAAGGCRIAQRVPAAGVISDLPIALKDRDLERRLGDRAIALFSDFDGTLAPIVMNPADAAAAPGILESLDALAEHMPVAIVSGRALEDLRSLVGSERLWLAGSHGFEIAAPGGVRSDVAVDDSVLRAMELACDDLRAAVESVPGTRLELKPYSAAVHYRNSPAAQVPALADAVRRAAQRHPELRVLEGKKIFELRPAVDWNKGSALRLILERMHTHDAVPVYLGDDLTDEDAFAEIRLDGVGIVVSDLSTQGSERASAAHDRLDDPAAVAGFLDFLLRNY
ncbi:MAG: trehalose-phosphatase [Microthrixaceae bacterium]